MPANPSPKPRARLESHLRALSRDDAWPPDRPLPTTRELAKKFGPSAATVFRLMQQLEAEGFLWQHSSGRFYRATARALLDRPKPVACLLRRLELCSALYRELLEGISAGAGTARRAMLLWHDDVLVNHSEPDRPPVFAGAAAQRVVLDAFLDRHGADAGGGFLLDHTWGDAALKRAGDRLRPGVLLFRRAPADLPLANVRADFATAATQALAHLLGRGFTRLVPVEPFSGDPAVDEFLESLSEAARTLGCADRLAPVASAHHPEDRAALAARPFRERTAFIVPEDHVAVRLHAALEAAGHRCPATVGLLAVMGTAVSRQHGLSRIAFDFRAMGRAAVVSLGDGGSSASQAFPPFLEIGSST